MRFLTRHGVAESSNRPITANSQFSEIFSPSELELVMLLASLWTAPKLHCRESRSILSQPYQELNGMPLT